MVQYTGAGGSCPDPSLYLVAMYEALAREIQSFVCTQTGLVSAESEAHYNELQTAINGLTNSTDLIDRITALQTFLNSLDVNNDGQLDAVVALQQIADNALAAAQAAQTSANAAQAFAQQVSAQLAAFQTTTQASLTQANAAAAAAQTAAAAAAAQAAANAAALAALQSEVSGWEGGGGITQAQLDAAICAEHARIVAAFSAARAAMSAVFAEGCPALPGGGDQVD